jgi:hypothetical protein
MRQGVDWVSSKDLLFRNRWTAMGLTKRLRRISHLTPISTGRRDLSPNSTCMHQSNPPYTISKCPDQYYQAKSSEWSTWEAERPWNFGFFEMIRDKEMYGDMESWIEEL